MNKFLCMSITNRLKEKGFTFELPITYDGKGTYYHSVEPRISQVLDWLRKEKRIDAGAVWDNRDGKWVGYVNEMDMPDLVGEYILPNTYDSYELAVIAVIEYIIDNNLI